jgi:hypothetical protein
MLAATPLKLRSVGCSVIVWTRHAAKQLSHQLAATTSADRAGAAANAGRGKHCNLSCAGLFNKAGDMASNVINPLPPL